MLKLIVCLDKDNGIGKNNQVPWKVPGELKHFKNTTLNHPVVMGHTTYLSIGRLLPDRQNIILSRNPRLKIEGAIVVNDINAVITLAQTQDVFVIGGKQIYELFADYYSELVITRLPDAYACDTSLNLNLKYYSLTATVEHPGFVVYYYRNVSNKIMFGKPAAEQIKLQLLKEMHSWGNEIPQPHLKIIQVGDCFASNVYIQNKIKLGVELGIKVSHQQFDQCDEQSLIKSLQQDSLDKNIHGILVQLPLPAGFDTAKVCEAISPIKDVDCFHPYNVGQMWIDSQAANMNAIPCTPYGAIQLLKYYKVSLAGKNVVVIGRSNIVGKPLASLLLKENCTVQICHSKTTDLKAKCKAADIVIAAIGKPNFVTCEYLKQGAIVVDVGINRDVNNKICGDVNFASVIDIVDLISPVPFGVGPMTLIMLFNNLLKCYAKQLKFSHKNIL